MNSENNITDDSLSSFYKQSHVNYLKSILFDILPYHYTDIDNSRITILYFAIVGLDILNELDKLENKDKIIQFIYQLQINSCFSCNSQNDDYITSLEKNSVDTNNKIVEKISFSGFIGGNYMNHHLCNQCNPLNSTILCSSTNIMNNNSMISNQNNSNNCELSLFHQGHLAMTYTALVSLITLGDTQLEKIDRKSIILGIKSLQSINGSFRPTFAAIGEEDLRFVYCACAISALLNDWTGVNIDLTYEFIISCITYEGGFALIPNGEAQGGATYCALASLSLMNKINILSIQQVTSISRWCEARQVNGYQGRTNKDPDSCYSFWVGGSLSILSLFQDTDILSTKTFLLNKCQQTNNINNITINNNNDNIDDNNNIKGIGGFSKLPDSFPDILHTFYSISWLSLLSNSYYDLKTIDPTLGICKDRLLNR